MTLTTSSCVSLFVAVSLLHSVTVAEQGQARQGGAAAVPAPISAAGRAELTDPAGDVDPIVYRKSVGTGPETDVKYPPFDVVKLEIASDGTSLTLAATLKAPPAQASFEVLEFYVDTDNNKKTGITHPDDTVRLAGLEYYGTLEVCLEHEFFGTTCTGTDEKPRGHSAIVTLEKYGKDWMFKDTLVSWPVSGTIKPSKVAPIKGPVVQAAMTYAAMGLKPGQVIRLVVREYCTGKVNNVPQGYFPEIVLALK